MAAWVATVGCASQAAVDAAATGAREAPPAVAAQPPTTAVPATASTATAVVPPVESTATAAAGRPAAAAPAVTGSLTSAVDALWAQASPSSCLVVSEGGRLLYERNADRPLIPASTAKLVTAAAVLHQLDAGQRLRTPVVAARPPVEGVIAGDVWLVGGGDPVLGTRDWAAHFRRQPALITSLEELADRVVAAGVRQVSGRVVGDDSRYDRLRYVASWPARFVADNETGPLSALSVNDGFRLWGDPWVPFDDPAAGAAEVFTGLLRQRGIVVQGGAATGSVPAGHVEIAAIESPTMAELVAQLVRESDNGTSELLVKELGLRVAGEGSTAAGTQVVLETLAQLGLPTAGVKVVDGSGLDPANTLTCRLLVSLLDAERPGGTVDQALPVAGQTGTLDKRFLGTPVTGRLRAKTGSIRGVAALTGRAATQSGRELTFAFVQNDTPWSAAKLLQDRLGNILTEAP